MPARNIAYGACPAVTTTLVTVPNCISAADWLIRLNIGWVVYAFNIWVSLFSVSLVAQGGLIAANIFTPREAKRLYGKLASQGSESLDAITHHVEEKPLASLLIAFGVGFIAARILSR